MLSVARVPVRFLPRLSPRKVNMGSQLTYERGVAEMLGEQRSRRIAHIAGLIFSSLIASCLAVEAVLTVVATEVTQLGRNKQSPARDGQPHMYSVKQFAIEFARNKRRG